MTSTSSPIPTTTTPPSTTQAPPTVGGPDDLTDFAIEAYAVVPGELARLAKWPANKPLDRVGGRLVANTLVTRTAAKNDC